MGRRRAIVARIRPGIRARERPNPWRADRGRGAASYVPQKESPHPPAPAPNSRTTSLELLFSDYGDHANRNPAPPEAGDWFTLARRRFVANCETSGSLRSAAVFSVRHSFPSTRSKFRGREGPSFLSDRSTTLALIPRCASLP